MAFTQLKEHTLPTLPTVLPSSKSVMSYPLSAHTNSTALTSSKHWIHFLLSDL